MRICGHKRTLLNTKLEMPSKIKPEHDHITQFLRVSLRRDLKLAEDNMHTSKILIRSSLKVNNGD